MISLRKLEKKMVNFFLKNGFNRNELQNIQVQVAMYSVAWILRNKKNFLDFSRVL